MAENTRARKRKREEELETEELAKIPPPPPDPRKHTVEKMLECPVCLHLMGPPIYQCCNGHNICTKCHSKVVTCPTCRTNLSQLNRIRNLVLEQLIELHDISFPCKFEASGCNERLAWGKPKEDHEANCTHGKIECPMKKLRQTDCHVKLKPEEVYRHLLNDHNVQEKETPSITYELRPADVQYASWPLMLFQKKVVLFVDTAWRDFTFFARHVGDRPIRYRLSVSQNGITISYSGMSEYIDEKPGFERQHAKQFALHADMVAALIKGKSGISVKIELFN